MANVLAVGKVAEFWRVLRDLNPETVRRELGRGFTLALLGSDQAGRQAVRAALRPAPGHEREEFVVEPQGPIVAHADLPRADLYIYVVNACGGLSGQDVAALEQLYLLARPTALVFAGTGCDSLSGELQQVSDDLGGLVSRAFAIDTADPAASEHHLADLLAATLPSKSLVMASCLAAVRRRTVDAMIAETSRVNAELALLSNLPANIPIVGSLLGAGADLVILTKNQSMLVLKLAAIYGRDLSHRWALLREIAPVVGAAFAWRTLARVSVGTLPTPIAALPKMAIAYSGTYLLGKSVRFYYEHGHAPSTREKKDIAQEAVDGYREALARTSV
ncbi:MAG: hypothetical protein ACYC4L_10790 [Chloroflexota bacterium]